MILWAWCHDCVTPSITYGLIQWHMYFVSDKIFMLIYIVLYWIRYSILTVKTLITEQKMEDGMEKLVYWDSQEISIIPSETL